MNSNTLRVAIAQFAPKWLDKRGTLKVIEEAIKSAAEKNAELLVFGEAFWPGYPYWLAYMDGAAWEVPGNKALHAHYLENAVIPEHGDLNPIISLASEFGISIYLGIVERAQDRGGHSLYCSLAYIDASRGLCSIHRKLQPTYDERLTWAPGDGHGIQVHPLKEFRVGGLNCWENWMPLARTALYGQGENVHIAVWPGSDYNTRDITRFIARESRSYVISASALMRREDFPESTPHLSEFLEKTPKILSNGGSCVAGPDGNWVLEPQTGEEGLFLADLSLQRIYQERQNFDPSGHYSRPDVTRLILNRSRQSILGFDQADI
ncbi:carbon-nitrogen hydrolase family protein [Robiginitalea aurantiaca]|uniref:Carbon-nitrogen hydrolase family protein n=1 Tax=Robiginitalea aurantiaca TaxID=3056915 RepID=A0ABT7WEU5_9FLAO|nr:carbon-nitrogen hydrolase family protein [Robiginitalea aurantiaca]MDM9631430.1 carbon-nitrogen hydrolase family protein [Robiginitalea aurantiaca]